MKKVILVSICILLALNFVIANESYVEFNGTFENGTTLYSDLYHVVNSTLYGKDVYQIHENCTSTQVCSKYNYTYIKNCTGNYSDICRRYAYHYERQCIRYASYNQSKCISYRNVKIKDECINYRNDLCRVYKTTKIRGDCVANRTQISCANILPVGCLDPLTGVYTNQLALSNFKMSIDNGTWQSIPYELNQQWINDSNLTFKVQIPSICKPGYRINKAIIMG